MKRNYHHSKSLIDSLKVGQRLLEYPDTNPFNENRFRAVISEIKYNVYGQKWIKYNLFFNDEKGEGITYYCSAESFLEKFPSLN